NNRTFDLLLILIENRGRLITKNELINKVWEGQFVEESNLTVQISALRRALDENKANPQYITTVQGRGYRFIAEVRTENNGFQPENLKAGVGAKEREGLEAIDLTNIPKSKSRGIISKTQIIIAFFGLILIICLASVIYLWRSGQTVEFS